MERAQARFERRKQAVAAVQNGESPKVVARVFGIGQRTLYDWLARYRHGGWDALREGRRSGRSRKAGPEVMQWLFEVVTQGDPYTHKFPFALWTLPIIMKLLKREHGIKLSKSSVSRLLQQLGLSPQRPVYRAYQQDPKALETYLNTTFPELKQRAQREGAAIYFVDESSVRSDHHRGTTWGEIGKTPVVADGGGRFSVHLVSAVTPRGDLRFQVIEGRMNADRFIDFLTKLRRDAGQPVIVIADNASYHKAKAVKTFCADPDNGVSRSPTCPPMHRSSTRTSRSGTMPSASSASNSLPAAKNSSAWPLTLFSRSKNALTWCGRSSTWKRRDMSLKPASWYCDNF